GDQCRVGQVEQVVRRAPFGFGQRRAGGEEQGDRRQRAEQQRGRGVAAQREPEGAAAAEPQAERAAGQRLEGGGRERGGEQQQRHLERGVEREERTVPGAERRAVERASRAERRERARESAGVRGAGDARDGIWHDSTLARRRVAEMASERRVRPRSWRNRGARHRRGPPRRGLRAPEPLWYP